MEFQYVPFSVGGGREKRGDERLNKIKFQGSSHRVKVITCAIERKYVTEKKKQKKNLHKAGFFGGDFKEKFFFHTNRCPPEFSHFHFIILVSIIWI